MGDKATNQIKQICIQQINIYRVLKTVDLIIKDLLKANIFLKKREVFHDS